MPYFNQQLISPNFVLITYGSLVGKFQYGEIVTGGTSGAYGVVWQGGAATPLILKDVVGTFQNSEVLTGAVSGATASATAGPVLAGTTTLTTPAIGPYGLEALSAVLSCTTTHGAGTLKVQVSNDVIQQANFPNVQPTNWVDMPEYNSLPVSVTMASGAICTFAVPYPLLSWRWYRFVWTPSDTTDHYGLTLSINALTRG
jgi:hypothetical protein